MQFLAPLFLAGAAAIALPFLFHLVRRTPKERVAFSAIMFLKPQPPRVRRRSRLEQIALLILRCLAICLLAFGFARPFFPKPPSLVARALRGGEKVALLLDTSASMRGEPWRNAVAAARRHLDAAITDDEIALWIFDRTARPLVTFDEWNHLPAGSRTSYVMGKLDAMNPGWSATRTGNALIAAAESLSDQSTDAARKTMKIVLISDVQRASGLEEIESYDWPKGLQVVVERTARELASNAALQAAPVAASVRVSNAPDAQKADLRLEWKGGTRALHVARGEAQNVALSAEADRVTLSGDDFDFDNIAYLVPWETRTVHAVYLGGEKADDPNGSRYYLQRAFQEPMPRYRVEVSGTAQKPDIIIATDRVADPAPLRKFIADGGTALLVLRNVAMAETLAAVAGAIPVEEAPGHDALLGDMNFQDPIFAPFADPRFGDFTKIHFWKHRRVQLENVAGAQVLARFDDGAPALFRVPVEKGHVIVLTAGWQPDDGQLALSSKFVPLMHSLLENAGAIRERASQFHIGDDVPLTAAVVRKPDGTTVAPKEGATVFSDTDQPGIYAAGDFRFAVNIDPRESELTPISEGELTALGLPTAAAKPESITASQQQKLADEELERRQKLWWWLIAATLLVLAVETLWAGFAQRSLVTRSLGEAP